MDSLEELYLNNSKLTAISDKICNIPNIDVGNNNLCLKYYFDCIDIENIQSQDNRNCFEGINNSGEITQNWQECLDYTIYAKEKWNISKWIRDYFDSSNELYYNYFFGSDTTRSI